MCTLHTKKLPMLVLKQSKEFKYVNIGTFAKVDMRFENDCDQISIVLASPTDSLISKIKSKCSTRNNNLLKLSQRISFTFLIRYEIT